MTLVRRMSRLGAIAGSSIVLFTVAFLVPAAAQTPAAATGDVVGSVVDSETGAPLPAATVRLVEVHRSELVRGDGRFIFDGVPAGSYTLTAARLGYATVTQSVEVTAGQSANVRMELFVSAVQLGGIIVTGAISARQGLDLLSAASILAAAELDRSASGTVASTLKGQPGVSMTSVGPATGRPVIRGLSGDRILVLEDGQRPGDLSSTSGDHAVAIEPLTATQMEVVRGPMSLLYGSSAMGGVVNVVREEIPESIPEHFHGVFSSQLSSVNRGATIGVFGAVGIGSLAVRGEASARGSGVVSTPAGELSNTESNTYNLAASAGHVGSYGHSGGSYRFYANDYGIPGGFVGGHEGGVDIEMRRHTGRAEVEVHPTNSRLFSEIKGNASFTDYRHVEIEGSGSVGTLFAQKFTSGDLIARHDRRGPFTEGAAGLRFQYRDIQTGGSLRTPSTYDLSLAGFLVEEMDIGPIAIQAGARYDWARYVPREQTTITVGGREVPVRERTFGSVSGVVGVLYGPREDVRIGASVSRAYRTPDFNELYADGPHLAANSYDVGDPDLRQETGIGGDLFARYFGDGLRAEIAAFANVLSDYVFPSSRGRVERGPQQGRPRLQYTNSDARFYGLEGEVEWTVVPRWVAHSTASLVRAEFTENREPIPLFEGSDTTFIEASQNPPLIPPLNGVAGVRYELPSRFAGVDLRWAAPQERLGDFEERTAGFGVVDLDAGLRMVWGERLHTLTLRVENVLDTEYREHLSRVKAIMPEPGRNFSLLYRLSY